MSEYISDPDLLSRLNSDEYVSDPTLLAKLEGEESGPPMPEPVDMLGNMTQQALNTAGAKAALTVGPQIPGALAGEVASWGRVGPQIAAELKNRGVEGAKNIAMNTIKNPIQSARDLGSAYVQGHNIYGPLAQQLAGKTGPQIAGAALRGGLGLAGQVMAAPESAFLYPYNMAAYEQAKIRANPNAPGLEYNPYAQTVRGEAATQNRAGAANQMRTVANMPFGNVNAQERAILEEDARMRQNIRKKAYEKVMGPVMPGSF